MKNDKKALIARINQNLVVEQATPPQPLPPAAEPEPAKSEVQARVTTAGPKNNPRPRTENTPRENAATGSGKQAAFWLDDTDRALFHEMGMLLYSQGIKPSHNLVLRAAIRMVPRDHRLVEQVRELMEKDGRKTRHQPPVHS